MFFEVFSIIGLSLFTYLLLKYSPLNYSTKIAFTTAFIVFLSTTAIVSIKISLDKYILVRNEEQCQNICDRKTKVENFENESQTDPDGFIQPGNRSIRNVPLDEEYVKSQYIADDDIEYSDFNTLYVPRDYDHKPSDYGYSFVPPIHWYNKPIRPPPCIIDKKDRAIVQPIWADGLPADLKEVDEFKLTGPMDINTKYIDEKLNFKTRKDITYLKEKLIDGFQNAKVDLKGKVIQAIQ